MAYRHIVTMSNKTATLKARVFVDSDIGEYYVEFDKDGKYQKHADYFASDKQDAISTAKYFVRNEEQKLTKPTNLELSV